MPNYLFPILKIHTRLKEEWESEGSRWHHQSYFSTAFSVSFLKKQRFKPWRWTPNLYLSIRCRGKSRGLSLLLDWVCPRPGQQHSLSQMGSYWLQFLRFLLQTFAVYTDEQRRRYREVWVAVSQSKWNHLKWVAYQWCASSFISLVEKCILMLHVTIWRHRNSSGTVCIFLLFCSLIPWGGNQWGSLASSLYTVATLLSVHG